MTPADTTARATPRTDVSRLLVPTLVVAGSLMAVVSSLGAPLIPTIADADHVSLSTAQWLLTVTLLTGAMATPVMGRFADGPRQREVIAISLGVVVVGCVLSAVSDGFAMLIAGRALQGVGLGLLPVAMAIARRHLPLDTARSAIATLSITTAIGAGLGYPITGIIAQAFDFRAAYWFGAITVGAALVMVLTVLPGRSDVPSRHLDIPGALLLAVAVTGLTVALSEGDVWGWTSWQVLGIAALCCVVLAVWILLELTVHDPLVDLRQVRNRSVLTADSAGFLISVAMYLLLPVIVEFVQIPAAQGYGFGVSVVVSGLVLLPMSIGSFAASRLLAPYERRFGARSMIPLGALVLAASAVWFSIEHSALWEAFVAMGIGGLAIGFTTGAMPGFIVRAVPSSEVGSATGFYQVIRGIGLSLGSALSAAVLLMHTPDGASLPALGGFRTVLVLAAGLCVVTAVVSYVLPGRHRTDRPLSSADAADVARMEEEEAELSGAGFVSTDELNPFDRERDAS